MVPAFLTVKVTEPAAADGGAGTKVIGPSVPCVSPKVTSTVVQLIPRQVADPSDRFWDVLTWRLAADR